MEKLMRIIHFEVRQGGQNDKRYYLQHEGVLNTCKLGVKLYEASETICSYWSGNEAGLMEYPTLRSTVYASSTKQ